jgi:UDP-N-acetylglucosamine--N-acetylmuramyl-(pentapeptide) pyrophosphoryl-undecaprenol N-acetylglucosamine transferase
MSSQTEPSPHVAIACGGTGGHLFPGLAVGREVTSRGGRVTLFISEKEVDRQAVRGIEDLRIIALPSVGLTRGRWLAFARGLLRSRRLAKESLRLDPPRAVLSMGGFAGAGPLLAARSVGARAFLHDSNFLPGRANRWLARFAAEAFVAFPEAGSRFRIPIQVTGTPVRSEFHSVDREAARLTLGLRPGDPVLLVMGGSQGAAGINRLFLEVLPELANRFPRLQFIHLTGATDLEAAQSAFARSGVKALVQAFCPEMHHALAAATFAISRAGGSSLAELAATRTAAVLVPYPAAAEDHQRYNASALARRGAALVVEQEVGVPEFARLLTGLFNEPERVEGMRRRLAGWQPPDAAGRIVDAMFARLPVVQGQFAGVERSFRDLDRDSRRGRERKGDLPVAAVTPSDDRNVAPARGKSPFGRVARFEPRNSPVT